MADFDAGKIDNIYYHQGAQAAAAALHADYLAATTPDKQAQLKSEMDQLKKEDSSTHLLSQISLDFIKPHTDSDPLTKGRIDDMISMAGNSQDDQYKKDMLQIAENQYGQMTSGIGHDFKGFFTASRGIRTSDVDKQLNKYEADRENKETAINAAEAFTANNGELFKRIAGDRGTIDKSTLQSALDNDAREAKDGDERHFTDDQRQAMQYMVDHWNDDAVNQLKDHQMTTGQEVGAGVLSSLPIGLPFAYKMGKDAGNLTYNSIESAVSDPTMQAVMARDAASQPDQPAAPAAPKAEQKTAAVKDAQATKDAPDNSENSGKQPGSNDAKPAAHSKHHAEHSVDSSDFGSGQITVLPGEGYWDVAARYLGYDSSDPSTTSLQQRRHELNLSLSPDDRRLISQLTQQLNDGSTLHAGDVIKVGNPDASNDKGAPGRANNPPDEPMPEQTQPDQPDQSDEPRYKMDIA